MNIIIVPFRLSMIIDFAMAVIVLSSVPDYTVYLMP